MYELEMAALEALVVSETTTGFEGAVGEEFEVLDDGGGGWENGTVEDAAAALASWAAQPVSTTIPSTPAPPEYGLPPGAEITIVTEVIIVRGEERFVPNVLFRLEGQSRWSRYDVWVENQSPPDPSMTWEFGQRVDKGEYDLVARRDIEIVRGEEVYKPVVYVNPDGTNEYYRLDAWEEKLWYLEKLAIAEKEATYTKG